MTDLLLFPFGGNSKEAAAVIKAVNRSSRKWNILGFIDDDPGTWGKSYGNLKVLGGRENFSAHPDAKVLAVPGSPSTYLKREELIASLKISPDRFASFVHPAAQMADETLIGYNTLIMAGVVATADVSIGNHCIILPNTVISHDSAIGDYSMVGSNVSISGCVTIGKNCYIGTGSSLIQKISIGERSLVGMGSAVLKAMPPGSVYAGVPARFIRKAEDKA